MSTKTSRTVTAPKGTKLHCKGWAQEAAWRMIQHNLDPEVAERPEELIVYGEEERLPEPRLLTLS